MHMIAGSDVQAVIARHVLGEHRVDTTRGTVTLRPHQIEGARRVRHLLDIYGGALVADDVGLGKTFLALAVARQARTALVIAPAALRSTWLTASQSASVPVLFASLESLALGRATDASADLIVIDEAQHLRNPSTRGFAACRELCANAKVLMLSATPVQNSVADLRVVLSLFLGERAHALSLDELASFVVKREAGDVSQIAGLTLPDVEPPQWLRPEADVDCLDRILALPPPLSPADGGDGGTLLTYTLVRQWASSRAALRAALTRRIARAHAIEDALASGRIPTRAELAAWVFADGAQQLAFPMIANGVINEDVEALARRVRRHREESRKLVAWLSTTANPDASRATILRDLLSTHTHRRVIAFSEHADTVVALFRMLAPVTRVAMLTHAGGRTAGGRITRGELLAAFASGARSRTHERDRVDLLLATDVLSEGVDLQDASIVVHLDLPWNPARLAQRVGRVRRLGSTERTVLVFAMAPPAPAARMLEVESRLLRKVNDASRSVGMSRAVLPDMSASAESASTKRSEWLVGAIGHWRTATPPKTNGPVCGAVHARRAGALACVRVDGALKLVAVDGSVVSEGALVGTMVGAASDESAPVDPNERDCVIATLERWLQARMAVGVVDFQARRLATSRRAVLRRADRIAASTPRHSRAAVSPLLFAARQAATAPMSAGAERLLRELTHSPVNDEAWLGAVGEFASLHAVPGGDGAMIALLLLVAGPLL